MIVFSLVLAIAQAESGLLCTIRDENINESSGVAISRRKKSIYWTHNDSGDAPRFFAFNDEGTVLGAWTLKKASAVDWEDMASAVVGGSPYLYFADVGDNLQKRKEVVIYRVPEPDTKPTLRQFYTLDRFDTFTLTYPDGAHNCETILVTPSGDIQLVTKSGDGVCGVYGISAPKKNGRFKLNKLGEFAIKDSVEMFRLATGGCMSADGSSVLMRTYGGAYLFGGTPKNWFLQKPRTVTLALEMQGESICFDFDSARAVTTSEGSPCRVSFARL